MDNKSLAIKLATCETEESVVGLLKDEGYWDDYSFWRSFGDIDNNFSTIGNQQSKPDAALVEKLINSVDAILMKECMIRNIDMSGPDAPQSMSDALRQFFNIKDGQLSYLDPKTRSKMAENIILAATGGKKQMNIVIADKGEGQTPKAMPETILSVSKNNKLRVPFVQGKFNMGGTGVLPFCGENRLQLVISKRCPDIPNTEGDETFDKWSVTIVRREHAREGRRSSMFTYLTDRNGNLLTFEADTLPIIPKPKGDGYEDMVYGTYFKLYNYALQGYKSNVQFDFNYRMSMLMPELAHPIRIRESRPGYSGHSFETTLSGLQTRLDEDRDENIEDGFPSSDTFSVDGQTIRCSIYVFKKGKSKNYRENDGILYTVNGQTHATANESFFNKVNLSYLADSLLVLVDCSDIDVDHREDMFMNSRDRLRNGEFVKEIEDRIKKALQEHPGLKKLQNERRAAAVQEKLNDDKPLQNVLQDILTKSPVLSKILLSGTRLTAPFKMADDSSEKEKYEGKKHPTFFRLTGKNKDGNIERPINHDFRIQFETDATNDYFVRPTEKGSLNLKYNGILDNNLLKHLGLFNGNATLTIAMPDDAVVGKSFELKISIEDEYILDDFETSITVMVAEEEEYNGGGSGSRAKPKDNDKKGDKQGPGRAAIPNIQEVYHSEWDKHGMDKNSALKVYMTDDASDYYLNMDNQYLAVELKSVKDQNRILLTKARFRYSMALIGMSIESYYKNASQEERESVDVSSEISRITEMLAPILVPMLESMAELELDEI